MKIGIVNVNWVFLFRLTHSTKFRYVASWLCNITSAPHKRDFMISNRIFMPAKMFVFDVSASGFMAYSDRASAGTGLGTGPGPIYCQSMGTGKVQLKLQCENAHVIIWKPILSWHRSYWSSVWISHYNFNLHLQVSCDSYLWINTQMSHKSIKLWHLDRNSRVVQNEENCSCITALAVYSLRSVYT